MWHHIGWGWGGQYTLRRMGEPDIEMFTQVNQSNLTAFLKLLNLVQSTPFDRLPYIIVERNTDIL